MSEDITIGPPDAAETFLEEWHRTKTSVVHVFQDSPGPYKLIELHDFKFLGRRFAPQTYVATKDGSRVPGTERSGAGVCAEFRDVLFNAQRMIFRAYAAETRSRGGTPTESGFAKWCGVSVVSGWQFRSRQHSKGAAIDIDAKFNPYVPMGEHLAWESGEMHQSLSKGVLERVRLRCGAAYANAVSLVRGVELGKEMVPRSPRDSTERAYDDLSAVHYAVVVYANLAFVQTRDNRLERSFGFARPFGPAEEPGSFLHTLNRYRPLVKGELESDLRRVYDDIRNDYECLRLGMVYGSLRSAEPGHMNLGAIWESATRDPCYGFLTIRREVAVGLRAAGCRWGAIDFGKAASGDMMHFDKRWGIEQLHHSEDPNPDGFLYVQA